MDYFAAKRLRKRITQIILPVFFAIVLAILLVVSVYESNTVPKKVKSTTKPSIQNPFSETVYPSFDDRYKVNQERNRTEDNLKGSVNIHYWDFVCGYTVEDLRSHPLFPAYPFRRDTVTDLLIRKNVREFGARIFGYIHPESDGIYEFGISSDDGSELWLSNDEDPINSELVASVSGISGKEWSYENQFDKYPQQISKKVNLISGRKYFFEALWKQERVRGHLQVAWRKPGSLLFNTITNNLLSRFVNEDRFENGLLYSKHLKTNTFAKTLPGHVKKSMKKKNIKDKKMIYHRQSSEFLSLPHIKFDEVKNVIGSCKYRPSWLIEANSEEASSLPEYGSVHLPHYFNISTRIFPGDDTWELSKECIGDGSLTESHCHGNNVGDETTSLWVTNKFMTAMERSFPRRYSLETIVNVEQSHDVKNGDRFLLEVVLKDGFLKNVRRLSVYLYRPMKSSRLCYPEGFQWKDDAMVNMILTVKNQGSWVLQYIESLSRIYEQTNDQNFNLIIIDFESFDADLKEMLKMSKLPHWKLIEKSGKFHKTSAIQEAIDGIPDLNSIALQTDLHLEFPLNFIDDTRKHCIQGKMGYTPLLMRLSCGRYSNKPAGFWEAFGYGIFGIYKSDWDRVGGMDVEKFRNAWGGEDWDFADRVIKSGLEIERLRVPNFFHYFHTKRGMWDNNT